MRSLSRPAARRVEDERRARRRSRRARHSSPCRRRHERSGRHLTAIECSRCKPAARRLDRSARSPRPSAAPAPALGRFSAQTSRSSSLTIGRRMTDPSALRRLGRLRKLSDRLDGMTGRAVRARFARSHQPASGREAQPLMSQLEASVACDPTGRPPGGLEKEALDSERMLATEDAEARVQAREEHLRASRRDDARVREARRRRRDFAADESRGARHGRRQLCRGRRGEEHVRLDRPRASRRLSRIQRAGLRRHQGNARVRHDWGLR